MKVAIVGAGMVGAYLYRLLSAKGHTTHIFNKDPGTACGITSCAWGTSRGFGELVQASGLDPSQYILTHSDYLIMDGLELAADVMTFDKRRLIEDLLQGAEIGPSGPDTTLYDRIIDATGVSRALLPPIPDDIVLPCVQYRMQTDATLDNQIKLGGIGYAWSFPLSAGEYHIGCGSLFLDPHLRVKKLGWLEKNGARGHIVCTCRGKIRLTGPHLSQPFVSTDKTPEVWGVGEAIGCVAPLAGDGVIPGMRSAQILVECWDDPPRYGKAILREFAWMKDERRVIDKLRKQSSLGFKEAAVLRKNSKRMGIQVGLREAALLLRHLN